jgi:hypothetical protein
MPAKASKRTSKREKIQVLAEQLQHLQPTDTAAAAGVAEQTCLALNELKADVLPMEHATACLPAILQCFCWLAEAWVVAAGRTQGFINDSNPIPADIDALWQAWPICLQAAAQIMGNGSLKVDVVRAILKHTISGSSGVGSDNSGSSSSSKGNVSSRTSVPGGSCTHMFSTLHYTWGFCWEELQCMVVPTCLSCAIQQLLACHWCP